MMSPFNLIIGSPVLAFFVFAGLFWGMQLGFNQSWLVSAVVFPILLALYFFFKSFQSGSIGRGMADVTEMPGAVIFTIIFFSVWILVPLAKIAWNYFSK